MGERGHDYATILRDNFYNPAGPLRFLICLNFTCIGKRPREKNRKLSLEQSLPSRYDVSENFSPHFTGPLS